MSQNETEIKHYNNNNNYYYSLCIIGFCDIYFFPAHDFPSSTRDSSNKDMKISSSTFLVLGEYRSAQ